MKDKKETNNIPIEEALALPPLTAEEAELYSKGVASLVKRMKKKLGEDRAAAYSSIIFTVAHEKGTTVELNGNMNTALYGMANAVDFLIHNIKDNVKLDREQLLLIAITDLAESVREIWAENPTSISTPQL